MLINNIKKYFLYYTFQVLILQISLLFFDNGFVANSNPANQFVYNLMKMNNLSKYR